MPYSKLILTTAFLVLAAGATPAWTQGPPRKPPPPPPPPPPRGAPGPIAAAGLPFLLAAGAIALSRRRRAR